MWLTKPRNCIVPYLSGVAWIVSNCNSRSRRGDYAEELKKYIDVDIYGRCGDLELTREREQKGKILRVGLKSYNGRK